MKKQLSGFNKLWLDFCARYDVKRNIFQESDDPRFSGTGSASRELGITDQGQLQKNLPDELMVMISPFINAELAKFEAERGHALGMRKISGKAYNDHCKKRLFRKRFPEAMSFLDQRIDVLSTRLDTISMQYEEEIQQWLSKKDLYRERNEDHMVQLCINSIQALRIKYYEQTANMYCAIVEMLDEKIKQIDTVEGYLQVCREYRKLRVRYYYQRAASYAKNISADYLRDEFLSSIANTDLLQQYRAVREAAIAQRQAFSDEISTVRQGN